MAVLTTFRCRMLMIPTKMSEVKSSGLDVGLVEVDTAKLLFLKKVSRVHLLGIGGAGMSALAVLLQQMGKVVSGSDIAASAIVEQLRAGGIRVFVGHDAAQINGAELVVRSTAVSDNNPEVRAAATAAVAVWRRTDLLAAISGLCSTVAVAGTHGKTTTTALLAHILSVCDHNPSYLVGAAMADGSIGARWGGAGCFIAEADESDSTFVCLQASHGLVTNVEPDHLRADRNSADLRAEFRRFCVAVSDTLVVCADDPGALAASDGCQRSLYGTGSKADYRWQTISHNSTSVTGEVCVKDEQMVPLMVPMAGMHNALNAVGALAMALELGVDVSNGAAAVGSFAGVARRFERRGVVADVEFIDDYAHLPTEVSCTLRAVRAGVWERVVCAFQPHRYTRTFHLWQDFANSFELADVMIFTDIYSAGEQEIPGVSGKIIWQAVIEQHPKSDATYLASLDEVIEHLTEVLRPGDLCLTLGAGDITEVPTQVMAALKRRR